MIVLLLAAVAVAVLVLNARRRDGDLPQVHLRRAVNGYAVSAEMSRSSPLQA